MTGIDCSFNKNVLLKRLKQARIDANLTHEEVAKKLGYSSSSTIGNYEAGRREISGEILFELAKLYGVSLTWLYGQNNDKNLSVTKLDDRELKLILAFREANEEDKIIIESILKRIVHSGDEK